MNDNLIAALAQLPYSVLLAMALTPEVMERIWQVKIRSGNIPPK